MLCKIYQGNKKISFESGNELSAGSIALKILFCQAIQHLPYLRSSGSTPLTITFFFPLPAPLPPVTAAHSLSYSKWNSIENVWYKTVHKEGCWMYILLHISKNTLSGCMQRNQFWAATTVWWTILSNSSSAPKSCTMLQSAVICTCNQCCLLDKWRTEMTSPMAKSTIPACYQTGRSLHILLHLQCKRNLQINDTNELTLQSLFAVLIINILHCLI